MVYARGVYMKLKVLPVEFRNHYLRPTFMASVFCPWVKQIGSDKPTSDWMGITQCNACGHVRKMSIDYEAGTGEVHCAAPV